MWAEAATGWSGQLNLNSVLLVLLIAGNAKTLWDKTGGNLITKREFNELFTRVNSLTRDLAIIRTEWERLINFFEQVVEEGSDPNITRMDGLRRILKKHQASRAMPAEPEGGVT